jgi:hypothetical protein
VATRTSDSALRTCRSPEIPSREGFALPTSDNGTLP